jgi:NAD(P)H-hydrate epimerase
MTKIFEASKIKEIDRYTIEHEPISSVALVERAAEKFTAEFAGRFEVRNNSIYVFAGQGNNGADALAVARMLTIQGYKVFTYLINPSNELSPECEAHKHKLLTELGHDRSHFTEVIREFDMPDVNAGDFIIDGLFGTGLNRPLEGGFAAIVDELNSLEDVIIVSIDIPSGLYCDDNSKNPFEHIIEADLTLTFQQPKLSFMFADSERYTGEWKALPIGLHPDALSKTPSKYRLITDEFVATQVQMSQRRRFSHKGDYGHALIVAGSAGKTGAAVLAAQGCMRSGTGLLTVHLPAAAETTLITSLPEAMTSADYNSDYISRLPDLEPFSSIGIGPGIGKNEFTAAAVETALASGKPLVIDADAINIIANNNDLLNNIPENAIFTPHPKEFDRLVGSDSENSYARFKKACDLAAEQHIIIVLKGANTAVFFPSGEVYFNTSGNPGMATAGSGDVLTGVITGLLAQGYAPEVAALAGVYLHGLAGDIAAAKLSQEAMLAGDLVSKLGMAFLQMHNYDFSA